MATKMRSRVSWRDKLDGKTQREVMPMPERLRNQGLVGMFLVPTPRDIDAIVKEIPAGAATSSKLLRRALAHRHGASTTCPLCTGIFLRIVAEAAEEARAEGVEDVTPYWRVFGADGKPNPKFPGGVDAQLAAVAAETQQALREFKRG